MGLVLRPIFTATCHSRRTRYPNRTTEANPEGQNDNRRRYDSVGPLCMVSRPDSGPPQSGATEKDQAMGRPVGGLCSQAVEESLRNVSDHPPPPPPEPGPHRPSPFTAVPAADRREPGRLDPDPSRGRTFPDEPQFLAAEVPDRRGRGQWFVAGEAVRILRPRRVYLERRAGSAHQCRPLNAIRGTVFEFED